MFLDRDPAGLPRPRCTIVGFFLHASSLDSLALPAAAPLDRKTRTEPRESAEITAVFMRLLLPLLPLDRSVEAGDVFAASAVSPVVSVFESSSSSESMPLLFNYDGNLHTVVISQL